MSKGFIGTYTKGDATYAEHCIAKRIDGKKCNIKSNLGRVIDLDNGIFKSRERGFYKFSIDSGYEEIDQSCYIPIRPSLLDLAFGDIWLFDQIIRLSGFRLAIEDALSDYKLSDTLFSIIAFKILDRGYSLSHAEDWFENSFAKILYPSANLHSQRISEFYLHLGQEEIFRKIFSSYLAFLGEHELIGNGCIFDSTGLENWINFYYTAVNNHNGVISDEMRLIYAIDRTTGMPIYFRYVPGNILDVSTMINTIREINTYRIDINYLILDAGYYSEENLKSLIDAEIPFLIRAKNNLKITKDLIIKNHYQLCDINNMILYNNRALFVKKSIINVFSKQTYAYLFCDPDKLSKEFSHFAVKVLNDPNIDFESKKKIFLSKGQFILLSSENLDVNDILPLYYTRQSIEQIFDIGKNNADLLPLRTHTIETCRGHLMASFLSIASYVLTIKQFKTLNMSPISIYHKMKNLRIKFYNNNDFIINERDKSMNNIIKNTPFALPKTKNDFLFKKNK
jgi:hypothetical protein